MASSAFQKLRRLLPGSNIQIRREANPLDPKLRPKRGAPRSEPIPRPRRLDAEPRQLLAKNRRRRLPFHDLMSNIARSV